MTKARCNPLWQPIPCPLSDIEGLESWLGDMAAQGLVPVTIGQNFARFRCSQPKAVRYRLNAKPAPETFLESAPGTPDGEERALAQECGWYYVTAVGDFFLYACEDRDAPELNTDEETLHQVLDRRLRSDIRRGYAGILFAVVWCAWNLYEALRIDGGLYSSLLSGYALLALCWVLLGGFWLVRLVAAIRAAETTQQRILLTRDYHCTATVRRSLRLHRATNLMLALALVIIAVLWITLDRSRDIPVSDVSVPTVSEVFPGVSPAPSRHPGSPHNENSWASESPSLLYRLRYVRQRGAYMIDPEIGQYRSSWYYDADVYRIAWTWLAEGYAREQAQEAGAETIAVPGWEHAWYAADADPYGGQLLVLQDGKEVWRIGYDGGQRLTDALDVFART